MALSVNGQNELNPNPRWRCLVPSGLPAVSRQKVFCFHIRDSILTKREVKMAGYWPYSLFFSFACHYGPRLCDGQQTPKRGT